MKKLYTLLLLFVVAVSTQSQVVISQVYGGGGNSGATYSNDFIELFNRGTTSQSLNGWSVQYTSANGPTTGTNWAVTNLPNITLLPGQYFLIQEAAGTTPVLALPTPDLDGVTCGCTYTSSTTPTISTTGLTMSANNGKVILSNLTVAETTADPSGVNIMDKVAYGNTTTSGYEGSGPTGTALTASTSASRLSSGCTDTNNNAADFQTGLPTPRNTATTVTVCSTAPSLAISSPLNGTTFNPNTTSVTVNIAVSNFTVAFGAGHIHYSVDGGTVVMKYDTAPIVLSGLSAGSHTVNVSLVNASHLPLSPPVNATVQFTIASFTNVANLAALRADVIANGAGKYYQIASNPIVTFKRANRNQKYIQDATAGIVIDDALATITTTMVAGDAITGLQGQSLLYNGLLELTPISNATIASSGNTVTPQVVTIASVLANPESYESELLQINGVTFDTTTSTTFAANTNYTITAPTATIFRTVFSATEVNYITQTIPTTATNIVAYLGKNTVSVATAPNLYFVSRSLADINLATNINAISGLSVYPNPVKNGVFYINTNANAERIVTVFDVLGKQVFNTKTSDNEINVSSLNAGVYMIEITEEGKTVTKKLVIE